MARAKPSARAKRVDLGATTSIVPEHAGQQVVVRGANGQFTDVRAQTSMGATIGGGDPNRWHSGEYRALFVTVGTMRKQYDMVAMTVVEPTPVTLTIRYLNNHGDTGVIVKTATVLPPE